jgi:hypothetical protein
MVIQSLFGGGNNVATVLRLVVVLEEVISTCSVAVFGIGIVDLHVFCY